MNKAFRIRLLTSMSSCLEYYDYALLIFLAPTFSQLFFPQNQHQQGLTIILSIYSVGYFTRLFGGMIFGTKGDIHGRKSSYISSINIMIFSTFAIALLPSFQTAGYAGIVGLFILRLIQGVSLGGELPGAIVFAAEHSEPTKRGFATAIIITGVTTGNAIASSLLALLINTLSQQQMLAWGWRCLFIFGATLSFISLLFRLSIGETPVFLAAKRQNHMLLTQIMKQHKMDILKGILIAALPAVCISTFYQINQYLSWQHITHLSQNITLYCFILVSIGACMSGKCSDKYGRLPMIKLSGLCLLCFPICLIFFALPFTYSLIPFILGSSGIAGVYEVTITEIMPTHLRYTGVGLCHNIAFACFGGTVPLLLEWLNQAGYSNMISILPAVIALPLLVVTFHWQETFRANLENDDASLKSK
ncbi:MAG: MFS transporter [Parashewanella sp.]